MGVGTLEWLAARWTVRSRRPSSRRTRTSAPARRAPVAKAHPRGSTHGRRQPRPRHLRRWPRPTRWWIRHEHVPQAYGTNFITGIFDNTKPNVYPDLGPNVPLSFRVVPQQYTDKRTTGISVTGGDHGHAVDPLASTSIRSCSSRPAATRTTSRREPRRQQPARQRAPGLPGRQRLH